MSAAFVDCDDLATVICQAVSDHNEMGEVGWDRVARDVQAALSAQSPVAASYGIIDPDYARVFTVARCIAWSEGYAIVMHGSFTRDLDLLAVPWTDEATEAEHLVRRIEMALDDLSLLVKDPNASSQGSDRPHGRRSWTFTFKTFGDPRFVDLSVMPRVASPLSASPAQQIGEGR